LLLFFVFVFQVCVSCAADKKGMKPEQEVNRHQGLTLTVARLPGASKKNVWAS
jgi:hypothetical protein